MSVVLVGPYDSRSYVIGSYILYVTQKQCESFFYQLIPMKTERWKDWLRKICKEENWNFEDVRREKVLSWREQSYSGGPKVLLGGLPSLLEYMKDKYGVSRDLTTEQVSQLIELSTEHWKEMEEEEAKNKGSGGNISIIGAGSNEAISFLLYALMTTKTPVIRTGIKIKLFEATDEREEQLKKNFDRMSTVESNINICIVDDLIDVLKNCDVLIFVGDKFRTTGMDIEKFLYLEKALYGSYGFLCNYHMEEQTKVIFACMENAAFNATCFLAEARAVDKKKVVALTSYLGTELKLYISKMAGFPVESLEQIPVWGMADTCHLVDADMGSLIFRVPDRFNPNYPNIKSLAHHIEDDKIKLQLYKMWKVQQDKCVAEWRWSQIKKNLKIEETKADIRNKRLDVLNSLASCYREMEKRMGRIPYWTLWDKSMAQVQEGEDYYSPENMYRRFRKGLYQVVQDKRYFENEEKKTSKKIDDEYRKLSEKAETLVDYVDPLKIGFVDTESIRKFLEEELLKKELKLIEDDEVDELFNETKLPEEVRDIEILRREVYNKRNELKKKIRAYWKKHMEEEIARLEKELMRKSVITKEEEVLEEDWMVEENMNESSSIKEATIPETVSKDEYGTMYLGEETFEEMMPKEITLPERQILNKMIKDYFRAKMKLERKVKQDLEKDSEPAESYSYEEIDDYEIRELGFITKSMRNLWNFIGVCKNAVRKKIGQDPYIAQVHELIRVLKIWFFDPYMTSETVFLGIASDYDVYPFLTDTVMSQPAYCDENFRWQPLKEAKHLWPKAPHEKVPDNAETEVPFFKPPREGLPFSIEYVSGISLECLMHFEIPPASYFLTQRKLQEYANHKEFFDLVFTTREADKAQLKDLFRRLGQEVESSVEDFAVEEEEEEEAKEEEEMEVEMDTHFETELNAEEAEELEEEDLGLGEQLLEEDIKPLRKSILKSHQVNFDLPTDAQIEELDKLGTEEFESNLEGEQLDHEGAEDLRSVNEEFQDEYDEDDPFNFLRGYGDDLTEDTFLAIFEKQKDPNKEPVESEMKPPKRMKSLWQCYLEKIGFYNLEVPQILVEVKENELANDDDVQNMESKKEEKPDNPFEVEHKENENSEEISKEEYSEEMSEEMSRQKSQEKTEQHPAYLMRGIGFIEDMEHDFCPQQVTEMPLYDHFNARIGVDIADKSINEGHCEKVGFPIEPKGRSQINMDQELMKIDVGSGMKPADNPPSVHVSVTLHEPKESGGYKKKPSEMPNQEETIIHVSLPIGDDNSDGGSTDSYIPEESIQGDKLAGPSDVITEPKKEDPMLELFKNANKKQEEISMNLKKKASEPEDGSSVSPEEYINNFPMEHRKESTIPQQQTLKKDWVHELVEEFNSPQKIAALDRASCLASVTSAYHFIKEKQRMNAENETGTFESSKKESDDEENEEERHHREAWIKGYEKLRRIMELERLSGNSYLHLELDKENDRIKVEVAHEHEKRFSDWVGSVIDEQQRIQSVHDSFLIGESLGDSKQIVSEENGDSTKKIKEHRVWIKQMIREIIVVDQIYDLEKLIQSVKSYSVKLPGDEILKTVAGPHSELRFSILEDIGNILKSNTGGSDLEDEILEPSDEDIPKDEEDSHDEQHMILREITKTEKEITKDCHDLPSYIQKCRDNTKLYCLYRGDTPQEWRFLNRQPNENKLRFKYKALIHIMLTMAKLQEDFEKEMDELQEQEIDFTKILSDEITEEELIRYQNKPGPKRKFPSGVHFRF
ncbi:unnamed protein product [Nezara viridula]|uniref:Uncharacterized protein n=1 Tax=Nezara viridula TaxID=85310 RepID=A0A9P0MVG9_NEZVI|nr:unnamed protein product [Nezara viridula]